MQQFISVIHEHQIDKKIKEISEKLYGKDKDIIYSNSRVREFIKEFNKYGTLNVIEDDKKIELSFENNDWCKNKKIVTIYRSHVGKFNKSKRLAVTLLCQLIIGDLNN